MGRSRLFSVTLVASLISISSTFGDPAVGNEANNKARGVLDMFGFGKPAQIDPNYAMGSPCYQPTTTTQAPLGPLCPLHPLDATESRPSRTDRRCLYTAHLRLHIHGTHCKVQYNIQRCHKPARPSFLSTLSHSIHLRLPCKFRQYSTLLLLPPPLQLHRYHQ